MAAYSGGLTVVSSEPWAFRGRGGRIIRTPWYRLFTTEPDDVLIERMPVFLERALDHYTTALGPLPRPPSRLDTFLMASREEWSDLTRQFMGDQSPMFLRIARGGFASGGRALLWNIGPHDTFAIAAHEGWHQYTQRTFSETLPVWLEEGIACFMEGHLPDPEDPSRPLFAPWANPERHAQLRAAAWRRRLMRLDELLDTTPQDLIDGPPERTLTYYAQVWALVQFLREGADGRYRAALTEAVADAAAGRMERTLAARMGRSAAREAMDARRGPAVFRAYFNDDLARATDEYHAYVRSLARTRRRGRE